MSKKDIFEPRENIKPYEYPELVDYAKIMHHSFWEIDEFDFDKDIRTFKLELNTLERGIIKKSMLAINVVENKVKSFWGHIDSRFPKFEVGMVGGAFSGNEVVHALCYSELLERLGLNNQFKKVEEIPCMKGRIDYLTKYLNGVRSRSNKEFTKSLILFTVLVENVALFSQFLILTSFRKYKNELKTFSKVIEATSKDEQVHAQFGAELLKIIRKENPEWFDEEMEQKIRRAIRKAYKAEAEVLDWIFERGELEFLPKESCVQFLRKRFNHSLALIGYDPEYDIDEDLIKPTKYFDRYSTITKDFDFFDQRPTDYAKGKSYDDIF